MNHTSSTSTCKVSDNFNLESFLTNIIKFSISNKNFIIDLYSTEDESILMSNLKNYINQFENNIYINYDSLMVNNNENIFNFLINQIIPIMSSEYLELNSSERTETLDPKVDNTRNDKTFFYYKDGKIIEENLQT
jgi:hypothetical protein